MAKVVELLGCQESLGTGTLLRLHSSHRKAKSGQAEKHKLALVGSRGRGSLLLKSVVAVQLMCSLGISPPLG